jgi:alpha-tubulin suppressor-like RCC1 family protein
MTDWKVALNGDPIALMQLPALLGTDRLSVTREEGEYWLRSTDFRGLKTSSEVAERAIQMLPYIVTATKIQATKAGDLTLDRVVPPDGGPALPVYPDAAWSWGTGDVGQLGQGDGFSPTPARVLDRPHQVAAGARHSLCITSDDRLWAWGGNAGGDLGDNSRTERDRPVEIHGEWTILKLVAAGVDFSMAAAAAEAQGDIRVWTWGANFYGQLGNGSTDDGLTPQPLPGPVNVTGIAGGTFHALAISGHASDGHGEVWSWGDNAWGQLGDGSTYSATAPVQVHGPGGQGQLRGIVQVAASLNQSFALSQEGELYAWGRNFPYGQLGNGTTNTPLLPVLVMGGVIGIDAGDWHGVALMFDGSVRTWGRNAYGELGTGSTNGSLSPVEIHGLPRIRAVAAGESYTLALADNGALWAWGLNASGQLGDGTTTDRLAPVRVHLVQGGQISAGAIHSLAIGPQFLSKPPDWWRQAQA